MLLSLLAPALQPHLARRAHLRMSSSPEAGSFELELFSPARLSLFLRVQPRADGLHDVARLSQAIDLGDRLQLARIPNTPSQAAGVVRPSRKTDPIKQHVEFSATPVGLPGLPAGLLREWPCSGSAKARQPGLLGPPARPPRLASPVSPGARSAHSSGVPATIGPLWCGCGQSTLAVCPFSNRCLQRRRARQSLRLRAVGHPGRPTRRTASCARSRSTARASRSATAAPSPC